MAEGSSTDDVDRKDMLRLRLQLGSLYGAIGRTLPLLTFSRCPRSDQLLPGVVRPGQAPTTSQPGAEHATHNVYHVFVSHCRLEERQTELVASLGRFHVRVPSHCSDAVDAPDPNGMNTLRLVADTVDCTTTLGRESYLTDICTTRRQPLLSSTNQSMMQNPMTLFRTARHGESSPA
jgi:hypothetical protein